MGSITVTNLGKAYRQYPTRWSRLREWVTPGKRQYHSNKWVLQGINFAVQPGEAVGIIGINGAGKSTLLKLITGTTQPTTGSVHMTGRVAAMLELGMGFHPDFTGRQNAFMAGQLLGIPSEDIARLMPEIEAFAEIGDYIDQPVRVYSSGMQMRLAFSVATAIRPDILIVDEALSVGDAYFQHKSFDRIREFRKQGTTLLIVSHDKQVLQNICDRAILLNKGILFFEGTPETVTDYYNALLASHQPQVITKKLTSAGSYQILSGTGEATVSKVIITDGEDQEVQIIDVGEKIRLSINIDIHSYIDRLIVGFGIKDRLGQLIYGTNTHHKCLPILNAKPGDRFNVIFTFSANLGIGKYSIQTALHSNDTHLDNNYEWKDMAHTFEVTNLSKETFSGLLWIDPSTIISKY